MRSGAMSASPDAGQDEEKKNTMIDRQICAAAFLALFLCVTAFGEEPKVVKRGQYAIDQTLYRAGLGNTAPWAQSAIETFNGYQYVTFYQDNPGRTPPRHAAARRKLPDGQWETFQFTDYNLGGLRKGDGHNNTVLGVCPADGTIHMSFDHHSDPLRYRVSVKGLATNPEKFAWEASLFSEVTSKLGDEIELSSGVTYPRFFRAPNNTLQFTHRIGNAPNGYSLLYEYSAESGWTELGVFITGRSGDCPRCTGKHRGPYYNGFTYDHNKRLHITWCWREAPNGNHGLNYAYSDDFGRTWRNNDGVEIGVTGTKIIDASSEGILVWDIRRGTSYINQTSQAVDSKGQPHVVTWHSPLEHTESVGGYYDPKAIYHHYYRTEDGKWHGRAIPEIARYRERPKVFFDAHDRLYLLVQNTRIAVATPEKGYEDWREIYSEEPGDDDRLGVPAFDYYRWIDEKVLTTWTNGLHARDFEIQGAGKPSIGK